RNFCVEIGRQRCCNSGAGHPFLFGCFVLCEMLRCLKQGRSLKRCQDFESLHCVFSMCATLIGKSLDSVIRQFAFQCLGHREGLLFGLVKRSAAPREVTLPGVYHEHFDAMILYTVDSWPPLTDEFPVLFWASSFFCRR